MILQHNDWDNFKKTSNKEASRWNEANDGEEICIPSLIRAR